MTDAGGPANVGFDDRVRTRRMWIGIALASAACSFWPGAQVVAIFMLPISIAVLLGTRFVERSGAEGGFVTTIADYGPFIEAAAATFEGLKQSRGSGSDATAEHVAGVIHEACVDETPRLRWVATQNIEPLVRARRETSEEQYMALMRAAVTPKLPAR